MKLADETYGQAWQMTIAEGPDVNAEECGHWYSPTVVARMIEEEREACAKACERIGGKMTFDCDGAQPGFWPDQVAHRCATEIMMRSNVELTGAEPKAERPR